MASREEVQQPAWPLVLLLVGLACIGLSLAEAARSLRSNNAVAARAVFGYSAFAAWSFREHLTETLRTMSLETLGAVNHGDVVHTGTAYPDASDLAHYLPWDPACNCHVTRKGPLPDAFLGFRLGSDTLAVAPGYEASRGSGPVVDKRLHDQMRRPPPTLSVAERQSLVDTLTRITRAGRPFAGYAVAIHRLADSAHLVISTFMPTRAGDTLVYAALYTRGVTDSILASVLDAPGLLPEGLAQLGSNRSILSLEVQDATGRRLFGSGIPSRWAVPVLERLPMSYGAMRVRLQIRPELADRLVIGGLPRSRMPLLLALLVLAAGLTVVAMVQMRRESRFGRERSAFVANVSHELRTPLSQIRLATDTLRLGREPDPVRRAAALALVDREVTRLQMLVESVLRFHRSGQEAHIEPPGHLDAAAEVRIVVEEFAPLAASRGVRFIVRAPETLPAVLRGGALRQVLLNLLDNAVKYGPDGQVVTVEVAALPGGGVRIVVQDEGPGVPPAERDLIWRPYARGALATHRAVGGSGIGLTVVQEIARQHAGSARLGEAGGGAQFVVELAGQGA